MREDQSAPLVSVMTPVYNGEEHLAECIESVLAQTYPNIDYTIVDNCSTDRSREIATEYASRDGRVRVHVNTEFLDVVSSINKTFTLASPMSQYCKLVAADDWLFPHCIEEMVALAEKHPSIGMVSSYVLSGTRVGWDGLPYPSHVTTGRDICRLRLLENLKVFGGPSASLIRSDILRQQIPFYRPGNYHGDNEAYLELLKDNDFGFIHQVLSYRRRGEASRTTSYLQRVRSYLIGDIEELLHYGEHYLSRDEYEKVLSDKLRKYYKFLAQSILSFRGREFWDYHLGKMKQLGIEISYPRLAGHLALKLIDLLLNPKRTVESIVDRLIGR